MQIEISELKSQFVAEAFCGTLSKSADADLCKEIVELLRSFPVLIFPGQRFSDEEQITFAEKLSGDKGHVFLSRMSNLDESDRHLGCDDFRRLYYLSTRLWHTDGSCNEVPSRYSALSARVVPPLGGETEFADMRAAYDGLTQEEKAGFQGLVVEHARAYVRCLLMLGTKEAAEETIGGVTHPLIHKDILTNRKSLYLSSNASRVIDMPLADGRLLLRDLIEYATEKKFVYRHTWRVDDFVIWNNMETMHRARPFDEQKFVRDLRRTTTPARTDSNSAG